MTALDVSHHSGSLQLQKLRAARDAGVTRLVVGTQDHAIARQQAGVALMLGLEVQAYVYLYFATNTAERVRRDLPLLKSIGATRYWLDAEDAPPGMTQDEKVAGLRAAVEAAAAAGVPYGIYTARWWWTQHAGNTPEFAHLPLWTAQWDGQADLRVFTAYGGWKSLAMKQYRPATPAEVKAGGVWFPDQATGIWCDVNVYAEAPAPASPPPVPGVTLDQRRQLRGALEQLKRDGTLVRNTGDAMVQRADAALALLGGE